MQETWGYCNFARVGTGYRTHQPQHTWPINARAVVSLATIIGALTNNHGVHKGQSSVLRECFTSLYRATYGSAGRLENSAAGLLVQGSDDIHKAHHGSRTGG